MPITGQQEPRREWLPFWIAGHHGRATCLTPPTTRRLGMAMPPGTWTRDIQKQLENHATIILVTRKPAKDRAPSTDTWVFYISFSGLGRCMRTLVATAKYHRSCATSIVLDPLPERKALDICESLSVSPSVWLIHSPVLCPSHLRSYSQAGFACQAAGPRRMGLAAGARARPAWMPQPGEPPFRAKLTAQRYRSSAC